MHQKFLWAKWRILLITLPLTVLYGLAKIAIQHFGWEIWTFNALTGSLFGAATFVVAFVLSGTLSDYNASADMTVQWVNALETIEDTNRLVAQAKPDYDPTPLTQNLIAIGQTALDWLQQGVPQEQVSTALTQLNPALALMQPYTEAPLLARLQAEQAKLRLLLSRMGLNRDTEFLGPAYVLLELFLLSVVITLLLIESDNHSQNLIVSSLLFMLFTYLLLLIRDLDNPFQYGGQSSVDVDLSPLIHLQDRLQKNLSSEWSTQDKPSPDPRHSA